VFRLLRSTHRSQIGIQITQAEIRIVELQAVAQDFVIQNYAINTLPADAIQGGFIRQFDVIQTRVRQLVKQLNAEGLSAVTAIPAEHVLMKQTTMPAFFSRKELEVEILANLPHYFGVTSATELCFDYVELGPAGLEQNEVLVLAVHAGFLHTYLALINQSGLYVKIIDVDKYALERATAQASRIRLAAHLHAEDFQAVAEKLQICLGLALRKIALW